MAVDKFLNRLHKTEKILSGQLPNKQGAEFWEALARLGEVRKSLSWKPKPRKPGIGAVGEQSIKDTRRPR